MHGAAPRRLLLGPRRYWSGLAPLRPGRFSRWPTESRAEPTPGTPAYAYARRFIGAACSGHHPPKALPTSTTSTSSKPGPRIGPLQLRVAHLPHPVESLGVRIEADGRTLCYSGASDALIDLARDANLFILRSLLPRRQHPPASTSPANKPANTPPSQRPAPADARAALDRRRRRTEPSPSGLRRPDHRRPERHHPRGLARCRRIKDAADTIPCEGRPARCGSRCPGGAARTGSVMSAPGRAPYSRVGSFAPVQSGQMGEYQRGVQSSRSHLSRERKDHYEKPEFRKIR